MVGADGMRADVAAQLTDAVGFSSLPSMVTLMQRTPCISKLQNCLPPALDVHLWPGNASLDAASEGVKISVAVTPMIAAEIPPIARCTFFVTALP